jgi:adrenodoxin-NADP+ reductase
MEMWSSSMMFRHNRLISTRVLANWFSTTRTCNETFKIAIVGTGPAGFYTGHHLLNKSNKDIKIELDFFERLPAPYGLGRYGVAPDHPEVKNCEEYLQDIMDKFNKNTNPGTSSTARFFGNVNIGKDISLEQLQSCYHSVILSYGCTAADNKLNIPGDDLSGVISARKFVQWYNGHPDAYDKNSGFIPPDLSKIEAATIIGNGNVALDVARVLLGNTAHWKPTDITNDALSMIEKRSIKTVNIIARRGILQSAFTNKEIRELLEMSKAQNIQFNIDSTLFEGIDVKSLGRVDKRKVSLLQKYDNTPIDNPTATWNLQYLRSPTKFLPHPQNPNQVGSTEVVVNDLVMDEASGRISVKPTGKTETVANELVILSIGYSGTPLEGFQDLHIKFEKNKLVNENGRIISADTNEFIPGWYTSGWIKNGPKGVIATTMVDSFETADAILEDIHKGIFMKPKHDIKDYLKNYVTWDTWRKLDQFEIDQGAKLGKTRLKVCNAQDMIDIQCK